jgi:hypothetical protein
MRPGIASVGNMLPEHPEKSAWLLKNSLSGVGLKGRGFKPSRKSLPNKHRLQPRRCD